MRHKPSKKNLYFKKNVRIAFVGLNSIFTVAFFHLTMPHCSLSYCHKSYFWELQQRKKHS